MRSALFALSMVALGCTGGSAAPSSGREGAADASSGEVERASDRPQGGGTPAPTDAGKDVAVSRYVPVTIDFDDVASQIEVSDQYGEYATFSSSPGAFNTTRSDTLKGGSAPHYMCAGTLLGSCGSPLPTFIDFTKPVRKLSFRALGVGRGGGEKFGEVRVVSAAGTETVEMIGSDAETWAEIDLAMFVDVTRIEISNDDGSGIGLDDVRFEAPE